MLQHKPYKRMLAASVMATLLGTSAGWAATVTTGYTPEANANQTNDVAGRMETRMQANTYKAKQASEDASAIAAARGDTTLSQDGTVVQGSDGTVIVNNSQLSTDDKEVKDVSKRTADTDLDKIKETGNSQVVAQVEAQYVTAATDATIEPYVGKTITGVSLAGVEEQYHNTLLNLLSEKTGDKVSVAGVMGDIKALGNTGVFSEVNPVFTVVPEGVKIAFQVTVNPIVKKVDIEGNTVYSTDNLRAYMNIKPDTVLNSIYVGQKIQGINAAYARDGYMLAHVSGINVDNDGVLHVHIVEGIVEDIIPAGNKKTKDKVITREFVQKKGQPFNKYLVRRSVERVYNLGFFDDVNIRMLPGSSEDKVIIEVDVLEHKTGTITLGAGYSDSDGMVGIVEFGEDNLRGTGDKFKIHWEFGGKDNYKNYQISYMKPWIDSKGTSLGVTYFNRTDEYTDYDENGTDVAEYNKKSKGFNISLGRQTGEYSRDYVTLESRKDDYEWDRDDSSRFRYDKNAGAGPTPADIADGYSGNGWDNKDHNFKDEGYIDNNFGRINSLTWQKVYDSRDNIYDPTRGQRISYSLQWAGHGLGGDFDFYKVQAEIRKYHKINDFLTAAVRGRIGYIQGDAPYSQLFTLGGADTLRGYEDDQFRGQKMYNATFELRFPVVKKVTGVLFVDAGDAWDAPNVTWYHHNSSFNVGYGAGVRVSTPIGPVRLDYGFGKNDNKFHFSFGTQF